jgi:hypothetical protein
MWQPYAVLDNGLEHVFGVENVKAIVRLCIVSCSYFYQPQILRRII